MARQETALVWNGPLPLLSLMDESQPSISLENLMQGAVVRFNRDLYTASNEGCYSIPILIAAPMLILRHKHQEEVKQGGAEESFFSKLEFPARLKPASRMSIDRIYDQLKCVDSLEEYWNVLGDLPTRVVFEFLVSIIQRLKLKLTMDMEIAVNMSKVDLGSPEFWSAGAINSSCTDNEFLKAMESETATKNQLKMRLCNAISYMWARDLARTDASANEVLIFRFIVVNFIHVARTFFSAEAKNTAFANDRFLIINISNICNVRTNALIQVMGVKLGRFLISIPECVFQVCYKDEAAREYYRTTLPVIFFSNLLLMNAPEVFYPLPKLEEIIYHDKMGCNFNNPQCVCQCLNHFNEFEQA